MALASSQLYSNYLQLKTPTASKRCEQCILSSWADVLQSAFAICNCSRAIRIQLPSGRETAGCICNWNCSRATYECSGPSCNCSRDPAIAAEILQLQPKFCNCSREVLGCSSRLQMHSAGPPPKRRLGVGMARLQFQIANALCSLAAHKGFTLQVLPRQAANAAESRAQRLAYSAFAFWNCRPAEPSYPTSSPGG